MPADKLAGFCETHHIAKLSVFGSALRKDFGPDSDVDVLVEFAPGHVPGFLRLHQMEEELSRLAGGRKIDLVTKKLDNHSPQRARRTRDAHGGVVNEP